jgi:hypothetical protein
MQILEMHFLVYPANSRTIKYNVEHTNLKTAIPATKTKVSYIFVIDVLRTTSIYTPERLLSPALNVSAELSPDRMILASTAFDSDQSNRSCDQFRARSPTYVRTEIGLNVSFLVNHNLYSRIHPSDAARSHLL